MLLGSLSCYSKSQEDLCEVEEERLLQKDKNNKQDTKATAELHEQSECKDPKDAVYDISFLYRLQ